MSTKTEETTIMVKSRYAEDLRKLADFIEAHAELFEYSMPVKIDLFAHNREEFAEKIRKMGGGDKKEQFGWFIFEKKFGQHSIELNIQRDRVCTKVKTGTKIVSKIDPEYLETAPRIEVEEDVYEWECPESILAPVIPEDLKCEDEEA